MRGPAFCLLVLVAVQSPTPLAYGAEADGELAKIRELELAEVRERISELKKSMDARAADRDRLTAELQNAEIEISEKRIRLREIERERRYTTRRKVDLDAEIEELSVSCNC